MVWLHSRIFDELDATREQTVHCQMSSRDPGRKGSRDDSNKYGTDGSFDALAKHYFVSVYFKCLGSQIIGQSGVLDRKSPITPFYKGESQEKTLLLRLEGAGTFACSPAHVMLGGSGFFFLQIHRDRDDALGYRCQQAGWWLNANHGSI